MNAHLVAGTVIALIYFSAGLFMKASSTKPNHIYGYRTHSSMRNMDTWLEANIFAGQWMMAIGSILIPLLLLFEYLFPEPAGFYPAILVVIVCSSLIIFVKTESHLKKHFFRDGKRKPYR